MTAHPTTEPAPARKPGTHRGAIKSRRLSVLGLVIARIVQGAGAALAAPSILVMIMENTKPGMQRSRAMALFVLASASGGAIGLILGGVLTTTLGWEWVMFVNAPIGILVILGTAFFLGETKRLKTQLDFGGAATSTIAMVALVYGFTTAAAKGWGAPLTIISFVGQSLRSSLWC